MRSYRTVGAIVLCVAAGAAAFMAAAASGRRGAQHAHATRNALCRWLQLSPKQGDKVQQADPAFQSETASLSATLQQEREKLASLLDNPDTPDDAILAQEEKVIAAHNALERRVMLHLLAVRPYLDRRQQRRLMGLCASGVRQAARRRWRGGRKASSDSSCSSCDDPTGRSKAQGRGRHGRGSRHPSEKPSSK